VKAQPGPTNSKTSHQTSSSFLVLKAGNRQFLSSPAEYQAEMDVSISSSPSAVPVLRYETLQALITAGNLKQGTQEIIKVPAQK